MDEKPSKSQLKRDALALQELGQQLCQLNLQQLKRLDLPQQILDAVLEEKRIKSHGAKRRQHQLLGKLLRACPDADDIKNRFEKSQQGSKQQNALFHLAERWRDRLLEEGEQAIPAFHHDYPNADTNALTALLNEAQNSWDPRIKVTANRALFRFIKESLS